MWRSGDKSCQHSYNLVKISDGKRLKLFRTTEDIDRLCCHGKQFLVLVKEDAAEVKGKEAVIIVFLCAKKNSSMKMEELFGLSIII